ncbi:hypothetical protein MWU59_05620 [Flavobacteriaceae bacterium F08102]|nr:hypothetical protein [Flavobacteriaceae bacterium F08102]
MFEIKNKIAVFESIAPYNQQQIEEALSWLSHNETFFKGVRYFYPNWTDAEVKAKLKACKSCADFQVAFIEPMISDLIEKSIDTLTITGLETIDKNDYHLYISNHRDIFLDSGLLQYTLYHRGYPFTEISLGDNLIVDDVIERVAKLNNMFTVFRTGTRLELLQNAKNLSAYLRMALTDKKNSAWIAQGNGRTKNGDDKTFPGLISMLMMSGGDDFKASIEELQIVVSSVSYEYEPCAIEKAVEIQTIKETGSYTKKKYENMYSILKGIEEYKGDVNLHFEKLDVSRLAFTGNYKKDLRLISGEIDRIVYKNYHLHKTNYMAHDLLMTSKAFANHYSDDDLTSFWDYLRGCTDDLKLQDRLLKMYAQPVLNKAKC